MKEEVKQGGGFGKFLDSFPPVIVSILVGALILVLLTMVPNQEITFLGLTANAQTVATTVLVPVILMLCKAFGVNLTEVYAVVKLGGKDMPEPSASAAPSYVAAGDQVVPTEGKGRMRRWLLP